MARTLSEEIAHLCLQWQVLVRDGFEDEAKELRERIQALSDRVMLLARQRNESPEPVRAEVHEMGVS